MPVYPGVLRFANNAPRILKDGYPLDSPRHYRLWFGLAVIGLLLGWFIEAGATNANEPLFRHVVPVGERRVVDLAENVMVMDAPDGPEVSAWRTVQELLSVGIQQEELALAGGDVVPVEYQRLYVGDDRSILGHPAHIHERMIVGEVRSALDLQVGICREHEAWGFAVVNDLIGKGRELLLQKVGLRINPIYEQP